MLLVKRNGCKLRQAGWSGSLPGFIPGNLITLLHNGDDFFPALEAALDRAEHEIYLETYIYKYDAAGLRIADALKRAVLRGVNAYVLIDGYGSKGLPQSMLSQLRAAGVNVLIYRAKISPWTLQRKRLRRTHRKIAVVDRKIAFVGGINISADGMRRGDRHPRYDYAVAVEGPLVDVIRRSSRRLWSLVSWRHFRKGSVRGAPLPPPGSAGGPMCAAFMVRDNFHHRRDIEAAYLRAINQAESEIIIASAYFLPGHDFRHALIRAAGRGVRVTLLLQGKVEYFFEHYASRALYGSLLEAGIEISEYSKSFLHAKVAVVDGHWATVGSSNIDPFSLLLSREANVVVDDEDFGATLANDLKMTLAADGHQILADRWKLQPLCLRLACWLSYGFVRLLMGLSGYASERGQRATARTTHGWSRLRARR